jgi:mono/diheme cytochrome c family protein
MHDQPKYVPLRASTFFADGSSARLPVPGTVARDHLRDDVLLYTGRVDDQPSPVFPFVVDEGVMSRGRDRFDVFCSPCHGRTGLGDGMVVQRGYARPPSLLENRLRTAPPGRFFDVMTNGLGAMPDYAAQIPARDRWAIAAYIRALQLAGSATIADVPQAERVGLEGLAR